MKERPIIMSGESVRAILSGRKTQTRRLVDMRVPMDYIGPKGFKNDPECWGYEVEGGHWYVLARGRWDNYPHGLRSITPPHGDVSDRLWVRETWADIDGKVVYRVDWECPVRVRWRSPFFMPRVASRIDLEILDVRVQRLQNITEEDALAEGFQPTFCDESWACMRKDGGVFDVLVEPSAEMRKNLAAVVHCPRRVLNPAREVYARAWDAVNAKRATWESNPWVWDYTFRRIKP